MRRSVAPLVVAAVLCVPCAAFQIDVEGGSLPRGGPPQAPGGGPPLPGQMQRGPANTVSGQVAGAANKISGWWRAYQSFVAAAAKVNQLISACCGLWLVMSTPLTLLKSVVAGAFTLKFSEVAMVLYLGAYGCLLLAIEVPLKAVQMVCRQYFFFVYTRPGRAAFVFNIALMAWLCKEVRLAGPRVAMPMALRSLPTQTRIRAHAALCAHACVQVGFLTKGLMSFNAILTFYILNSQDRRFAAVDEQAKQALQQAQAELGGSMSEAVNFGKMFSGAFGGSKLFGAGGAAAAPPQAPVAPTPPQQGGGFSSMPDPDADSGGAWPTGGGGGA